MLWSGLRDELELLQDTSDLSVTTSNAQAHAPLLVDGNLETLWTSESDFQHTVTMEVPNAVTICAVEMYLKEMTANFLPELIETSVGNDSESLEAINETDINTFGWTSLLKQPVAGSIVKVHIKKASCGGEVEKQSSSLHSPEMCLCVKRPV
eukprot:TRINITY_DN10929_c0_g1_i1.p4 TRINITY_DN10929_c0_g1~~TRINITY_DN10929_c0_g1_i1.p4  ORF type:complete len:152 (+),score=17.53 TRINITY_DN10929_c0_g1_i1:1221-1676(+)